ncbi:MAG: GxxExxY protein [Planctomycetales bacterium]|nr:GxxExxY protein [Planctomycetales bacterium]
MLDEELTRIIIGCAYDVHNALGSGFLESVYEKALIIELRARGLSLQAQAPLDVIYRGESVGSFFADVIVEERVIVELKAIEELAIIHEVQLVNYLKATGIAIGLLINFGPTSVTVRRKYRDAPSPNSSS